MLCHNHPSGNLKPSRFDEMLTQRFREAGKILDIDLYDHLIITSEGYYSFSDEGAIF
jgi:DNA repair protein RadC